MSKRILLIDDVRNLFVDKIARTYREGIVALKDPAGWDELLLDHDLGVGSFDLLENKEYSGYDIMLWLEEHIEFLPRKIILITNNPVGKDRMQVVIDKLYEEI